MNAYAWTPVWEVLLQQLVVPVAVSLLLAAGSYAVSLLPGPIRNALSSATHKRDMELLLGAMLRAALSGKSAPDVVAYARENLRDTVAKLAPSPEALQTMAEAMVTEAAGKIAAAAIPAILPASLAEARG